jgi:ribosomal protein S18 acetylase RimI-like enzyme
MIGVHTLLRSKPALQGLEHFDPLRDLQPVISLLQEGFQNELDERDRRWLAEMSNIAAAGPLVALLTGVLPWATAGLSGYVWYEDGRLVANASLMRSKDDVWLVANVVTDPAYRRRGICRRLMDAVLFEAETRGGRQVQLQVRQGNEAAHALYETLGFRKLHATARLRLVSPGAATRLNQPAYGCSIVRWSGRDSNMVRRLLARADDGQSPLPHDLVRAEVRRGTLRSALGDWFKAQERYRFAAREAGSFRGVAVTLAVGHGLAHRLEVVTDPSWRGRVEASLIDACLAQLARRAPRPVEADVDERETGAIDALQRAGFKLVRTLDRLALDLT